MLALASALSLTTSLTCGDVRAFHRSQDCCGADASTVLSSPTCNLESPIQQMLMYPSNYGQCIDIGLAYHVQRNAKTIPAGFEVYTHTIQTNATYDLVFGPESPFAGGNPNGTWIGFDALFTNKMVPAASFNCPGVAFWWGVLTKMFNPGSLFTVPDGIASYTFGASNTAVMEAFAILGEILEVEADLGFDQRILGNSDSNGSPTPETIAAVPVSKRLTEVQIDAYVTRMAALKSDIDAISGYSVGATLDSYANIMAIMLTHLTQHLTSLLTLSAVTASTAHSVLGGVTIPEYWGAQAGGTWLAQYQTTFVPAIFGIYPTGTSAGELTHVTRPYSDFMAWGDPITDEDLELVCGGMGSGATIAAQGTGSTGRFVSPLSGDFTTFSDLNNGIDTELPTFSGFLGLTTPITLADCGVTATDSPGVRYAKVYGLLWWSFGMTAISHPITAYGAKLGPVVGPDGKTYDGVVQGKGPCTHHKAVTHLDASGFGFGTGDTLTGYLNMRFFFKLTDGVMKMMYQQHISYWAVETTPIPGSVLL